MTGLNSGIQEACSTTGLKISNVTYQNDTGTTRKKFQHFFDSFDQNDYILTGDIPNYQQEIVSRTVFKHSL